jgi:hypothetical protein
LENEQNSTFQSFKDKSNQAQRVLVIFLGASFFFFFMILLPYFSLRVDNYNFSILHDLSDTIIQNVNYLRQKFVPFSDSSGTKTHIGGQDLTLSEYSKLLASNKTNLNTLKNLTDESCGLAQPGNTSSSWFVCNLNFFTNLPKINKTNIQFNSTDMTKINDTIKLQYAFLNQSKSIQMDTTDFVDFKNKLMHLYDSMKANRLERNMSTPSALELSKDLRDQNKILKENTRVFLGRFNATEFPIVGKIPISFNDLVAVFPLALAISFFYFIAILRDSIRLRKILEKNSQNDDIQQYLSNVPFWIDPTRPKRQVGQRLSLFMSWIVLALPGILFIISVSLILYIWDVMFIENDVFPPFTAALNLNKFIYQILYGISSAIFIISYLVLIKEMRTSDKP